MNSFGTHDHKGEPVPLTPVVPVTLPAYPKQTAWSFSNVQQHNTCPLVIRFRKIDRLPEPKSEHLQRGLNVHAAVEAAIKAPPLALANPDLAFSDKWMPLFQHLRFAGAQTEVRAAFDRNWEPVADYFAPNVWLRVVLDAIERRGENHIDVWEWKTGKQYEDHHKQARLYALAALLLHPSKTVDVRIRYLDRYPEGHDILNFTPAALEPLKQEFTEFSHDYLNDTIYPARPNRFCRGCHFRRSNGGPCTYG